MTTSTPKVSINTVRVDDLLSFEQLGAKVPVGVMGVEVTPTHTIFELLAMEDGTPSPFQTFEAGQTITARVLHENPIFAPWSFRKI